LSNLLNGITLGAVILGSISYISKQLISYKFTREMEKHKSNLVVLNEQYKQDISKEVSKEIEKLKYLQQKTYKEFELHLFKKHEVYPELFKLTSVAYSRISKLSLPVLPEIFPFADDSELDIYLTDFGCTNNEKKDIINKWIENKNEAYEVIKIRMKYHNYKEAAGSLESVVDFYLYNKLFLSENINKMYPDIYTNLYRLLDYSNPFGRENSKENDTQRDIYDSDVVNDLEKLEECLKSELSFSM